MIEFKIEDNVECPYCEKLTQFVCEEDWFVRRIATEHVCKCQHCKKIFDVDLHLPYDLDGWRR